MARPWRISLANSWYHVVSRGNGGEVLFRDDTDRRRFLGLVSEMPERFSVQIHAFVLMSHHYHWHGGTWCPRAKACWDEDGRT